MNTNKIAAVLTKNHFIRSSSKPGYVASRRNEGFMVTEIDGGFQIKYVAGSKIVDATAFQAKEARMVADIAKTLVANGYSASVAGQFVKVVA